LSARENLYGLGSPSRACVRAQDRSRVVGFDGSGFDCDKIGERLSMATFYTHHGDMPLPAELTIKHTSSDHSSWSLQQALRSREPLEVGKFQPLTEDRPRLCGMTSERGTAEFFESSYICTIPTSPTTWGTYLLILRGAAASQAQEEVHDHLMRKWEPTLRAAQDTSPSALANLWRESTHEAMREWGEDQQSGVDPLLQTDIFQLDHVAAHDQHHLEVHAGTLPQYLVVSFEEFPLTAVSEDGTARFELQSMFE
jgi:hypothetical protein